MRVGIIADDLTGANDTGVKFARKGLTTSVWMSNESPLQSDLDVLVIDTDSRSLSTEEAYQRVKQTSSLIKKMNPEVIYKKVDSTLRGNIGIEIKAVYDSVQPDFIIIAPAYPNNGRTVKNGVLFIEGKPLHETEFAHDPKTPVFSSNIAEMIEKDSKLQTGIITMEDLVKGMEHIHKRMTDYFQNQIPVLIFDAVTDKDLEKTASFVNTSGYQVVWSGSAGLADFLIESSSSKQNEIELSRNQYPVLMVVGSVHKNSRKQLELVSSDPFVKSIKVNAQSVVGGETALLEEIERVLTAVKLGIEKNDDIVLYSSGNPEEIKLAQETGASFGMSASMVSEKISETLGYLTAKILEDYEINRLFLTGGDTAKKVCLSMGIDEFKLLDEVENGIPIGTLVHPKNITVITKAGGFGAESSLIQSLSILRGGRVKCGQSLA
ncbi:four-carbon acid sugar kinase family protein [Robertmurraya massiliosenegalensis]|uniref:four-carbon acid sugar kinase family protein n=1 Tax=Robertmurraya massiliosenegalensis TaxID=1287657 RepID=UPI0002E65312|nr:four-carbon acid sugar kinase family protein [Robertmurraya massiliosenegalensis]